MSLLTDFKWKSVYRSGDQNLFKEFYAPSLKVAVQYDRAVGYFSSEALVANLQGIAGLVKNQGKMRLIIGHPLDDDEFEAIKQGYRLNKMHDELDSKLKFILESLSTQKGNKLELLAWLIAENRLEVRYALRRRGMYHEKIGIIYDAVGNQLAFQGSANETIYALGQGFNAESLMVFKSWNKEIYEEYGKPCETGFERLWQGEQINTITLNVPSDFYEKISAKARPVNEIQDILDDEIDNEVYDEFFGLRKSFNIPKIPEKIGGNNFELYEHQRKAINSWIQNSYKGLLKLSTGSGKTITSIYAAVKVYDARKKKGVGTVLIVSVPYQELAKQWVENLEHFNIHPVKCWHSKKSWFDDLNKEILDFNFEAIDFISIVVVNRTMESGHFQDSIRKIPPEKLMLIGDECHNHGAKKTNAALPMSYYRIGLSATPYRSDDDEIESPFPNDSRERINKYYGNIVAEYSLGDAINDGVLCEYKYYVVPVFLTPEEQGEYEAISLEIGKIISQGGRSLTSAQNVRFTILCGKRSRLLGAAENKISALKNICSQIPKSSRKHSLFYCGEGKVLNIEDADRDDNLRVINEVSRALNDLGWESSRFTSNEPPHRRREIMENFKSGSIDALVSMKVLDEGVDVPVCDKAFILASTRNPRQYIQRRGRVLRKNYGKSYAEIWDFVILPIGNSPASKSLLNAELERIDDFVLLASNRYDVEREIDRLNLRS